jgi:hypothetical protein
MSRRIARLSPAPVAEGEQTERNEQQRQKENMAAAHHEHDYGNRKTDRKHTNQRTSSNSDVPR